MANDLTFSDKPADPAEYLPKAEFRVEVIEHLSYWVHVEATSEAEALELAMGIGGADPRAEDLQVNHRDWNTVEPADG